MPRQTIKLSQTKQHWPLYALLLPSLALIAVFAYYPAISGIYHAFFRWDGDEVATFVGLAHFVRLFKDPELWWGFLIIAILFVAGLFKMIPSIATAVVIHRTKNDRTRYVYRLLLVIPMVIPAMVGLLIWKFFYNAQFGALNSFLHWSRLLPADVSPAWISNAGLVIPSLIFWGFPWLGIVGVLVYLSGLERIGKSVYECAELDGVGWFGKFLYIELPLIATQIRLMLILRIIGIMRSYNFQFILFGVHGGPGGRAMVPGLYMFNKAFDKREAGYACAIGILLFFFIVALTYVNNKFVRVKK
jgi:raffinose/stachyose/melibiose transport system permease protein